MDETYSAINEPRIEHIPAAAALGVMNQRCRRRLPCCGIDHWNTTRLVGGQNGLLSALDLQIAPTVASFRSSDFAPDLPAPVRLSSYGAAQPPQVSW